MKPRRRLASPPSSPPYDVAPADPRLPPVLAETAARLARFRAGMSDSAFERLVIHAATFRLRWGDAARGPAGTRTLDLR